MKKLNTKGFSAVEILIVIVVIGLLGAIGWIVYDRQNNKVSETTNTSTATAKDQTQQSETVEPFNVTGFSLDASKLPEGWTVTNNTAEVITVSSAECFIEATKESDATLSSSKQPEGVEALLAANDKTGTKGYVVTNKGTSTLAVYNSSGSEKITSYEFLWDLPDGENPFRYSRAYSVNDGYYVSVKRSCSSESDFADTDTAMSALLFK